MYNGSESISSSNARFSRSMLHSVKIDFVPRFLFEFLHFGVS